MKKTFAFLLFSIVIVATAFAQDKPRKGDVIYGVIRDGNGPVVGANVTERNGCDRIMAQTTTDINGEFAFRTVNPENRLTITKMDYETIDISINKTHFDLNMKEQAPLQQITILDGPALLIPSTIQPSEQEITEDDIFKLVEEHMIHAVCSHPFYYDMLLYPIHGLVNADRTFPKNELPGGSIYIPYTDGTTYYSIEDFFNNWYPRF